MKNLPPSTRVVLSGQVLGATATAAGTDGVGGDALAIGAAGPGPLLIAKKPAPAATTRPIAMPTMSPLFDRPATGAEPATGSRVLGPPGPGPVNSSVLADAIGGRVNWVMSLTPDADAGTGAAPCELIGGLTQLRGVGLSELMPGMSCEARTACQNSPAVAWRSVVLTASAFLKTVSRASLMEAPNAL